MRRLLGTLLAFLALNAFGGGVYGMGGAPAVPTAWLAGSPFQSYFWPGVVLFAGVGGTLAVVALAVFMRHGAQRGLARFAGSLLLAWIAAQVAIIGFVSWLQPAMALAGLAILAMAEQLPPRDRPAGP